MQFLVSIASVLNRWTSRWIPGSFSIALLLTLLTIVFAMAATPHSLAQCLVFWGDGFWELLTFGMQMTLIMVTGYIVVVSPPVNAFLHWFSRLPRNPHAAIALTALGSMLLAWINWGLGILGSAVLVKYMAKQHREVDYRLLVAVAYFGLGCTWHAGLSASAPILSATPGHFMEKQIGVIPLSQTIFHPFNLTATVVVLAAMTTLAFLLHPRNREDRRMVADEALENVGIFTAPTPSEEKSATNFLDYRYALNLILGSMGVYYLVNYFFTQGFEKISINTVNFAFLTAGILLHKSPASVMKAAAESAYFISNIVLQFPFYSGMYGIIKGSGLSNVIGNAFVQVATPKTLPLIVYWYSGVVNYFVPSGGSKWAVEAPYIAEAAKTLGVAYDQIVVAYAWGDMMTDLLQPFWAIPLLAAAGIEFKEILGYEMIAFLFYAVIVSLFFFFLPFY
ncbi:TIGR00366 family protein [bacterium]|nr:TIGR00366 family protein [bacterium]